HDSHRGTLRQVRCAFGPRLSGWPRTNRPALLHELRFARLQAQEITAEKNKWSAGRFAWHSILFCGEFVCAQRREITRCQRSPPSPWAAPACSALAPALAFSDLSFLGCALRRRP